VPVTVNWPPEFLARTYPTKEEAEQAGIKAGERWVQGLHPDQEFV